jgi:Protein of unknown function (DUF3489)
VIHVITTQSVAPRKTIMTTFTIDEHNNITAFGSKEEATAATATPLDSFTSQKELGELANAWPADRLLAIWNGLPGVEPGKRFRTTSAAVSRIWERIQSLAPVSPVAVPAEPKPDKTAKRGAHVAKGASLKTKTNQKATAAKKAPKGKSAVKPLEASAPREGSKTSQVVAMLQRKTGATLAEIMDKMGWQRHTVRGFMAGAMKKAGYAVESFKSDKGERTYRISQ